MKYDEIKEKLAPCGLSCAKCQGYAKGDIQFHASELKRLLGLFDSYAERFSDFMFLTKAKD
ncbi:MAG: hypothetical protein ABH890_06405 [Bacillota bacterium]